jgi:hypothetical protein
MTRTTTLLDLVTAVGEYSRSEAELIATVVDMVNKTEMSGVRDVCWPVPLASLRC